MWPHTARLLTCKCVSIQLSKKRRKKKLSWRQKLSAFFFRLFEVLLFLLPVFYCSAGFTQCYREWKRSFCLFLSTFYLCAGIDLRTSLFICSSQLIKQAKSTNSCRIVRFNWHPSDGLKLRACSFLKFFRASNSISIADRKEQPAKSDKSPPASAPN